MKQRHRNLGFWFFFFFHLRFCAFRTHNLSCAKKNKRLSSQSINFGQKWLTLIEFSVQKNRINQLKLSQRHIQHWSGNLNDLNIAQVISTISIYSVQSTISTLVCWPTIFNIIHLIWDNWYNFDNLFSCKFWFEYAKSWIVAKCSFFSTREKRFSYWFCFWNLCSISVKHFAKKKKFFFLSMIWSWFLCAQKEPFIYVFVMKM